MRSRPSGPCRASPRLDRSRRRHRGDGLQEYHTRSSDGSYNQGWKTPGTPSSRATESLAKLPIALCEHQGLVVAAKRHGPTVVEDAFATSTSRLVFARRLTDWPARSKSASGGRPKAPTTSASTATNGRSTRCRPTGPSLWQQAVDPERAAKVVRRLMTETCGAVGASAHFPPSTSPTTALLPTRLSVAPRQRHRSGRLSGLRIRRRSDHGGRRHLRRHLRSPHSAPRALRRTHRDAGGFPVQYLGANVPQGGRPGRSSPRRHLPRSTDAR